MKVSIGCNSDDKAKTRFSVKYVFAVKVNFPTVTVSCCKYDCCHTPCCFDNVLIYSPETFLTVVITNKEKSTGIKCRAKQINVIQQ